MFINKEHEAAYKLLQEGDYEKAVRKYTHCIQNHPDASVLYSERGVAYIHLQDKDKSLADLDKSVSLEPAYAYRYASRGHARDFFGDLDGAIEDYELAAEIDPSDPIVYNNLGLLLEKKGNMLMATDYYERSDKLRKQEQALNEIVNTIERGPLEEEIRPDGENTHENHPPKAENETQVSPSSSTGEELKKIFTEKSQWKEFLRFIKNGFRIK